MSNRLSFCPLIVGGFLVVVLGALAGFTIDDMRRILTDKEFAYSAKESAYEQEVACLREALYHEGRGGLVGEQIMQGMVILARVRDPDPQWPKTVCGVVKQPGQFSYKNDKVAALIAKSTFEQKAWDRADKIARQLLKDVWVSQLLPRGAECVRAYKVADSVLNALKEKDRAQLNISQRSLGFFERKMRPVFTVGKHTFYASKDGCKYPLPTT